MQLEATPIQMGILNAMSYAPFLVVTLFAGVFVDRWQRRRIMIVTNLGRAAGRLDSAAGAAELAADRGTGRAG